MVELRPCRMCICACTFSYFLGGSGDEDMTSLLDLLHSCPITNLTLRTEILRCLMAALKESHRCSFCFTFTFTLF